MSQEHASQNIARLLQQRQRGTLSRRITAPLGTLSHRLQARERWKSATEIDLSQCETKQRAEQYVNEIIASHSPEIEALTLWPGSSYDHLTALLTLSHLTHLTVRGNRTLSINLNTWLGQIVECNIPLQTLDLSQAPYLANVTCPNLARTHIETLILQGCERLGPDFLELLPATLRHLDLRGCVGIREENESISALRARGVTVETGRSPEVVDEREGREAFLR